MNEEAKRCAESCREWYQAFSNFGKGNERSVKDLLAVADLIESLSAQLDQVTRERDAAVKDLKLWYCFSCNNKSTPYCQECTRNRVRLVKGYLSGRNHYEWRGAEVEG